MCRHTLAALCLLHLGFTAASFPALAGPLEKLLLRHQPALSTGLADVTTDVPFLDGLEPQVILPMTLLPRTREGAFVLRRHGVFEFHAQSYCLHAGKHGPGRGEGYAYAPLAGPEAEVIRSVLRRSYQHPEIPQHKVQVLLWAILARTRLRDMSPSMWQTAGQLLTPSELIELNGGALGLIPGFLRRRLRERLPEELQEAVETGQRLREALTTGQAMFEEIERIAVLAGEAGIGEGSRSIPEGRWSYDRRGFFVRYLPSGYSHTQIQVYFPGRLRIERDSAGRIATLADERGNRLEVEYDAGSWRGFPEDGAPLQGCAFKAIRFQCQGDLGSTASSTWEGPDLGWTLVEAPGALGAKGEEATEAPGPALGFSSSPSRLEKAREHRARVGELATSLGLRQPSSDPATASELTLLLNLLYLDDAVRQAITTRGLQPELLNAKTCSMLTERAVVHSIGCLVGGDCGDSEAHQLATKADGAAGGEGAGAAAAAPSGEARAGGGGAGETPPPPAPTFDPTEQVAVPGNTARQRLGQSPREDDEGCRCTVDLVTRPEEQYLSCDGSYTGTVVVATSPDGEGYQWSMGRGSDKARFSAETTSYWTELTFTAASDHPDDVQVSVHFQRRDESCSCSASFSVRRPDRLDVLSQRPLLQQSPQGVTIGVARRYGVLDQFGDPLQALLDVAENLSSIDVMGQPVTWSQGRRRLSMDPSSPGSVGPQARGVDFLAFQGSTDGSGTFVDEPQVSGQLPPNLNLTVEQEILVAGCSTRKVTMRFLRTGASLTP